MKSITLAIICILMLNSCKNKSQDAVVNPVKVEKIEYASFGKEIIADDAVSASSMAAHYKIMKAGDSINSKIIAEVHEVCQAKGCWMRLNLDDENEVMVKFKDYGFFVPKNAQDKEVIVNGKAFVSVEIVAVLKHYAKDAGKSQAAIDSITEPKVTYSFMADGVLIAK